MRKKFLLVLTLLILALGGGGKLFAENGNVAKVGNTEYATIDKALAATKTMTGDVTVEIYDKVTFNQPLIGDYTSINFVGKDTDAEMYLDVQGYTTATGKEVTFTDLKLSKSVGGHIANAGFMNVAFGIYDVVEVTYTNCTFLNGACASSGKVTFNGCTFYRSHDKYGLWAYGNVDVTVENSTFADYRGIKMYDEGKQGTVALTVKNTDFSAVNNKPAIVLTYGESVQLAGNTYSTTGVFELDIDGKPNGVAVTSDVAPVCVNDKGACGVLVDGTIYTTVAQAAEVATSTSTVTLLHNSTETVEFPMGVTLEKNGFAANGVTVVVPVAQIGEVKYETFQAALKAIGSGDVVITLLKDVTMDITAWQTLAIGAENTTSITIDGENGDNDFTLTFNKLNSDWNHIATSNDNATKLILKNLELADSGKNNGPWNRYDHNFACDVELTNVVSNKALAFKAGATLNNVTINETGDNYAIWIQPNGQDVDINGLTVVSAGRGIKIDNQYVGDAQLVNLSVKNATFKTVKKAAIVVKSPAGANIVADNVDITNVEADSTNLVWVDEDGATDFGKVILTGGTVAQEGLEGFVAAISANDKVQAYYTSLQAAINAVKDGETITLTDNVTGDVTLTEKVGLHYTIDGAGKTMNGAISVNSLSDTNDNRRITIKNINFKDTADANVDFISSVNTNHYPRLTIEGCTFTGSGNDGDVAVRLKSSHSVVIKDCTGTGLHSFLQNTSGWNLTIENVKVTESKSGLALGTVQGVTVKGSNIDVAGYGIRMDAGYNNNAVIESNTIKAFIPVVVRKATVNSNIAVNGTNNLTATNSDGIWCAIGTSEYEENGKLPTDATGKVSVTLNDTELSYEGVYGNYYELAGEGTAENPYLINSVYDLKYFRDKVDEQAQDGSTQFAGKYFKLTADLDLAGINWNPIGSMSGDHGSFKGVFDGGNHTISNLNCEQAGNGLGLFARTAGNAEIKNLKLNNVTVKSTDNSNYVGGVVGNAYASTKINNVHVSGTINIAGRGYIGGIAGHGYVVMDNVSVVANEGSLITSTFWCAGGILGYAGEGSTNIMNANVEDITITSAAGGLGAIVGMAEDNKGTQPISGSNLSAKNVEIKTYDGAYGTSYANYALGYLYGGNETSILTGELSVENVNVITSTGEEAKVVDAVANVDGKIYFNLASAIATIGNGDITINLLRDVTLDYNARDEYGIEGTTSVTINGNNHTLTLNQKNSDWASIGLANNSKLVLKNMTIEKTGYGDTNGAWNTHAIIFSCPLEMTDVTVNNAIAVQAGAILNNVAINEANGYYGLWINGNGQSVTMKGGSITATNGGRGIKIADQYIDNPAQVTLNVTGTVFKTAKKAAVLVSSKAGAKIAASNVNIENVAADKVNFVWVDEDWAANYGNVEVTGATVAQEGNGSFVAAVEKDAKVQAYYKDLHAAMVAAKAGETVVLIADVDLAGTEWEPVSFGGTFDGKGKTISNLTINKPGVSNTGFIKSLNGTVKNVKFTNPTVTGGENTAVVAGIAGGSAALAENITINGTIKVETTHSGYARAAAIVGGWAYGNYKNITVDGGNKDNSYIKHTGGGDGRYVAGIVGHADDVNSYVNCTVKNITISGGWLCGGIAGPGPADKLASNCSVENIDINADYSGGMFGWYYGAGTIENATIKNVTFTDGSTNNGVVGGYGHNTDATVTNLTFENVQNSDGKPLLDHVASIGDNHYFTLADAIATIGNGDITINLLRDVTLDYNARDEYGIEGTTSVTINGNNHTLTLNQKNSDWASIGLANNSKLVLKNMTIEKTGYGDTNGAWNTHAIIFSCPLEMTDVTVNNAIAVQAGAILNNVAINEANGYYGLWINGNGQSVTMKGGSITATNGGRGIKIADQYIDNPAQVTLNVTGTVFKTAKKAAVLVSSKAGAKIAASNVNIENVAADKVNFVWVDEDWAANYGNVEVTGATVAQEGNGSFVAAVEKDAKVQAYYKDLHAAMVAAKAGETVVLIADVDLAGTEWEPVSFGGTFDGKGKTISNLTINKPGVSNTGFIKSLNGTVKNVKFTNPTVTGGENTAVVAGIAGGSAALAENITINGTIKVETTHSGYARAAAIVGGWAYGNYKNITVDGGNKDNSYIKHTGGGDGRYVAGIVGHADDVNSYVNCTVKNITISGGWLCGGIAGPGPADKLASNCSVENIDINADYSGGMFGWYYGAGTIENATIKNVTFTDGSTNNGVVGGYGHNTDATVTNLTFENVQNSNGAPLLDHVASIDNKHYFTFAAALAAAQDGDIVTLIWSEGKAPIEMNAALYGKNVTISGTAKVDWSKGFLFVGRGGEGNATLTFDNANLTSASNSSSYGIHVSGREKNTNNKYDGTVVIKNSTIELDYLINRGTMTLDNGAVLTVKNGFGIAGRPASETENNENATATITLNNASRLVVNNHNGMGLGQAATTLEGYGIMNINSGATFETKQAFKVSANGTMNNAGTVNVAGALTNNGTINFTDDAATLATTTEGLVIGYNINQDKKVVYGDGAYKVVDKVYVAQVGTQKFETLQAAVNAVEDGDTITLIADEVFTKNNRYNNNGYWDGLGYSGDKSFTIDLAEKTIKQDGALNDYLIWIKNDGSKDNTINIINGTIDAGKTAYCALATASSNINKITINTSDINFVGNNSNGAVLKIRGGAELNAKAGTIITGNNNYVGIEVVGTNTVVNINEGAEIYQNGTDSYVGSLAGVSFGATLNVIGGKGTSAQGGFIAMTSGGTINVSGGEWIANTKGTPSNDNKGVLIAQSEKGAKSIVNVKGGTFRGGYNCYGAAAGDAQINIKGGNFNANPTTYVVDKYEVVEEANGTFTVKMASFEKFYTAAGVETTTDQAAYSLNFTVTDYENNEVSVKIGKKPTKQATLNLPTTVEFNGIEYTITLIPANAFHTCYHFVGDLVIPATVKRIENGAFQQCFADSGEKLGTLTLNENLTYIGNAAFLSSRFKGDLVVPSSVEYVGNYAFNNSGMDGTLTINCNVTNRDGFNGSKFTKLVVSEGVISVGFYRAFAGMKSLKEVTLPSTLKEIGNEAFYEATAINKVYSSAFEAPAINNNNAFDNVVKDNATLCVENYKNYQNGEWEEFDNVYGEFVIQKEGYSLLVKVNDYNCSVQIKDTPKDSEKRKLEIPAEFDYFGTTKEITSIAADGFKSCNFYGEVVVPGTIKTVGNNAFNSCYKINRIVFENGVESIGRSTLGNMYALTYVEFPASLKTIGDKCFTGYGENHKIITIVSYATEVPVAETASSFQQYVADKATLYVFEDVVSKYKNATGWSRFKTIKPIEAKIGETVYYSLAKAIEASKSGDVITLIADVKAADANPVVIPTGVTLDINTHDITANIYGTVKTDGGLWTTVAVPGFNSRDMLGEGAIYNTTDATVVNLANEVNVLAGTIVLNPHPETEWWTLPGQSLSIATGATFEIPSNVKFTVRENTNVVVEGTLVTDGTVYLQAGATVRAEAGLNIQTTVAGHVVDYNNDGVYSVVEQTIFTQTIQLNAGWNWFSSYVETDLESLQAALGTSGVKIKDDNLYTDYYAEYDEWYGSLNSYSYNKMYMIKATEDIEISISGNLINTNDIEITLVPGWNWISYPNSESVDINIALQNLDSQEGDKIKSDSPYADYYEGYGWYGSLNILEPGVGYMYYNSSNLTKTFTYSTSTSTSTRRSEAKANVTTEGNYWTPNAAQFANNMTMTAVLDVENINYEVAAFVNGECRGSARPIYVEALDAYMLFLTIHGEEVEEMTFKYYDIDTDTEYTLSDRINYSNNAILGSLKEPYMFTRGTTGIGEAELSQLNIYPNPTTTAAEINLNATFDKVEVFNALGVKVAEYSNVDSIDALETAGIYVIRATNNSVISHCRLVVK